MGPALSTKPFKFGSEAAQMYNVIVHGGPQGMPAWGSEPQAQDIAAYLYTLR